MSLPTRFVMCMICVNLTCLTEAYILNHTFKRIVDKKLMQSSVRNSVTSRSLLGCVTYCTTRSRCVTLSWRMDTETCLLSGRDVIHDNTANNALENATQWLTAVKIQYPVFQAQGPGGRYSLDFGGALALCQERGTTLASSSDMRHARSLGLGFCRCGWLSDGSMGFVLQSPSTCTTIPYSTGVIYCWRSKADAWCITNEYSGPG